MSRSELGEPRGTRSLALQQGKGRPGGQPGTASCGGKLPGQQPCIAASYRQAGGPSLSRLELGEPRGTRPCIPAGKGPAREASPRPHYAAGNCLGSRLASQRAIGRP